MWELRDWLVAQWRLKAWQSRSVANWAARHDDERLMETVSSTVGKAPLGVPIQGNPTTRCRATQTDPQLIRTKVNLVPTHIPEVRVVDIVGLDKQADGGTHVRSTGEVGRIRVTKTESKGTGNKRIRLEIIDA